jgi:hypothetical protein
MEKRLESVAALVLPSALSQPGPVLVKAGDRRFRGIVRAARSLSSSAISKTLRSTDLPMRGR